MIDRSGALIAVAGLLVAATVQASSATLAPARAAPPSTPPAPRAAPTTASNAPGTREDVTPAPAPSGVSADAAARSRMHECGHQWSTMKKNGSVGALTWKDFSATCLVMNK